MTSNRKEIEKTILGGWILGKHMKDMDKITSRDFREYPQIVDAIRECGANIFKVSKKAGVKVAELAEMTGLYTETFYEMALNELYEEKARAYIANVTGSVPVPDIIETLESYRAREIVTLPSPAENIVADYWAELDRRAKQEIVNTNLTDLDKILCGIRTKELTAIGARPSVGKSAFALQIAVSVAKQGKKVLYFPLEMSTTQTVERMLLRYIDIPQGRLKRGDVEWKDISKESDRIARLEKSKNFLIFEAVSSIEIIKALVRKHKPYLIVIDQLDQLKSNSKFKDKRERFSYMTSELKRLSMVEDTAVMLVCQVNRGAESGEPTLANLKESGSIEEDSDNVILLHRIPAEDMTTSGWDDNNRPMLVNVAKQRQGATGTFCCKFVASKFTFYGLDR